MIKQRLLAVIPTLLIVLFVAMLLYQLAPTDPAVMIAGDSATPAKVAQIRAELGLNKPLPERYVDYVGNALRGNLGESYQTNQPVSSLIFHALPVTFSLALIALIMMLFLGVPAGVVAAVFRGRWPDHLLTAVTSVAVAIPSFVAALVLVVLFAVQRDWLPSIGYVGFAQDPVEWLLHLILPAFALALPSAAELARQIRGSMLDMMEQDFVRTQYAKGLSEWRIIGKHVAKNSGVSVMTVLGLQMGRFLGGVVIVETLFALPGLGYLSYQAVIGRDLPVIQGVVVVTAVIVLAVNFLVDLSYLYFSPRMRSAHV
jgi:peptide/nickel transport system permease protein